MWYSLLIARRYFFGKTRINAINWISVVSLIAIAVVTMGLVSVLSVYNGYVDIIKATNGEVDPPILIKKADEQPFNVLDHHLTSILQKERGLSEPIITTHGMLMGGNNSRMVNIVGLGKSYLTYLRSHINLPTIGLNTTTKPMQHLQTDTLRAPAIIGAAIAADGDIFMGLSGKNVSIILPRRLGLINPLAPASAFCSQKIAVRQSFPSVRDDVDNTVYIPIETLRSLLSYNDSIASALIFFPKNTSDTNTIINHIQNLLGNHFSVLSRINQHPEIAILIKTEKFMTYLVMLFVLLLAVFNVAGCVIMMIIEKKQDLFTMSALGIPLYKRKQVFRLTGMLISLSGIVIGMILGLIFCVLQQKFGFISSGNGFGVSSMPIHIELGDLIIIFISSVAISYIMIFYSTRLLNKQPLI